MKQKSFSNELIVSFEVRSEKYLDHSKDLYLKFSTRRNFQGDDSFTKTLMFERHKRAMILYFESMHLLL